jgi:hypothetical protein
MLNPDMKLKVFLGQFILLLSLFNPYFTFSASTRSVNQSLFLQKATKSLSTYKSFRVTDKISTNLTDKPHITTYDIELGKNDFNFKITSSDPNLSKLFNTSTDSLVVIGFNVLTKPEIYIKDEKYGFQRSDAFGLLFLVDLNLGNLTIALPINKQETSVQRKNLTAEGSFQEFKNNFTNPFYGIDLRKFYSVGFVKKNKKSYVRYISNKNLNLDFTNISFNSYRAQIDIDPRTNLVDEIKITASYKISSSTFQELENYLPQQLSQNGTIRTTFIRKFSHFNFVPKISKPQTLKPEIQLLANIPKGLFIEEVKNFRLKNAQDVFGEFKKAGLWEEIKSSYLEEDSYIGFYESRRDFPFHILSANVMIKIFSNREKAIKETIEELQFSLSKKGKKPDKDQNKILVKKEESFISELLKSNKKLFTLDYYWLSGNKSLHIRSYINENEDNQDELKPLLLAYLQKYPNDLTDSELNEILKAVSSR